ncbi:MAG: hypothetical protein B7Y88_13095 [Sphingomonadales bacterium 32-64-17]|nr:MAG: hypothetical protein B7Y88_13095 [Sphingomonadales bacterium 32-64-17]
MAGAALSLLLTGSLVAGLLAGLSGASQRQAGVESVRPTLFTLSPEVAPPKAKAAPAIPSAKATAQSPSGLLPPAPTSPHGGEQSEDAEPPVARQPALAPVTTQVPQETSALAANPAESSSNDETTWNAYQALVWRRVLAHRPAGLHMMGEATLRFTLDADGALVDAEIYRSSGNRMLDRLALRALRSAAPFPLPPTEIEGRALTFTVNFHFN